MTGNLFQPCPNTLLEHKTRNVTYLTGPYILVYLGRVSDETPCRTVKKRTRSDCRRPVCCEFVSQRKISFKLRTVLG